MCFKLAMLSLHTSPVADLGRTRNAGGMNVYVRELARELGRGGMHVDIFTRRADPDSPAMQSLAENVRLIQISAGPPSLLPPDELLPHVAEFTRRVARVAERHERGYDLVHSHYWLSGLAGLALAATWQVPHVSMFHTVEQLKHQRADRPESPTTRLRVEQERRIALGADSIIVSTSDEAERLARLYHLCPDRLRVIPCGVDLRLFTPGRSSRPEPLRAALAPDGQPLLLFVGRLDPIKGIDLLLESLACMRTPARLAIVGGNPPSDPEVARLRALAEALGIGERVWFPGAVPQRELPSYYRAADALVVTSSYESFGLVAVEALACGTPVVAAHVGGLSSIVRHGENGLLVRWRSPEGFAEQLDALLEQPDLRRSLARGARRSVAAFDWPRIGDRVRAVYADLAGEQRHEAACSCL